MLLAFRRELQPGAGLLDKAGSAIIKTRLVSDFYHGGVVVNNILMHSTLGKGLHCTRFQPEGWWLLDVGTTRDTQVLDDFLRLEGAKYDLFSLAAFVVPWRMSDAQRWYCFEWQWYCLTGEIPTFRVTPEKLFQKVLDGVNLGK